MNRSDIQRDMIQAAIASIDNIGKAAWIASVGVGKSFAALQVVAHYNPDKITWLTSNEELRDVDTPNEFIKWGYEYLLERTTIMCYQSSYKLKDYDYGVLVCDELDASLTEEYLKSITNNKYDKGLFITGSITQDKRDMLEKISIPIVYEISTNTAQDLGVLNKTKIVFVEYDLDNSKNILMKTKSKSWMTSENDNYLYWENQYLSSLIKYLDIKKTIDDHYSKVKVIDNFNYESYKSMRNKCSSSMKWRSSQRAKVLHTLSSSKVLARKLSNKLLSESKDNKVIIFSSLTSELDSYIPHTIHSKNKKGNNNLELFNKGEIREVGVISMIDRGKNMVGLNKAIFESYDGSETKGSQRIGRICRLLPDDEGIIYVLIPFYYNKRGQRLPTRGLSWGYKMFSNYNLTKDNFEIIRE